MMGRTEFDARYAIDGDPWNYRTSEYERDKYAVTLAACGQGPFRDALELGGSIGVFSALLAPRCDQLTTVDFSAVAVAEARRELAGYPHVDVREGEIPVDLPAGASHDLIVASEVLYYLTPSALGMTLSWMTDALVPGGRLVVVHWRPAGPERPFSAEQVHDRVGALPELERVSTQGHAAYLLEVFARGPGPSRGPGDRGPV